MALFDKLKKMQSSPPVNNSAQTKSNDDLNNSTCNSICITDIPTSIEEFKAMNTSAFKDPFQIAALTVVALCVYPYQKDISIQMLNYLKGPQALSQYEMQFLRDRLKGKEYLPSSYFVGATPENDYTPQTPSLINVYKTSHSEDMINEGYMQLFLKSGGADSARPVRLRFKPSSGEWFLWEYFILADIRKPKSESPWE